MAFYPIAISFFIYPLFDQTCLEIAKDLDLIFDLYIYMESLLLDVTCFFFFKSVYFVQVVLLFNTCPRAFEDW